MLSLKHPNVLPPQGYSYVQPETGMVFDGNTLLPRQIKNVLAHRIANHLDRATADQAREDIMAQVCSRSPSLCIEIPNPPPLLSPAQPSPAQPQQKNKVRASRKTKPPPPLNKIIPTVVTKSALITVRKVSRCGACGGRKKK